MTNSSTVGMILGLGVLIILSGFFAATETAFTSFSHVRMKTLAVTRKKARIALKLAENYDRLLSTILIGNNIVNIVAASIATLVFTFYWENMGVTISTIVMTTLILIFGEITPKSIAKEKPESFAMFSAIPLKIFTIIFAPINLLFNWWKKLMVIIFKLKKKQPSITEEEFKIIVSDIKDEGVLNEIEHDLIRNTLKYDEQKVEKIMTPLESIKMISSTDTNESIKKMFIDTNFSRVPIYKENTNSIIGLLYRADFYEMLLSNKNNIIELLKQPIYIQTKTKISKLFRQLQENMIHMAIVKNGEQIVGLITMEDILEELVGEIEDRYD